MPHHLASKLQSCNFTYLCDVTACFMLNKICWGCLYSSRLLKKLYPTHRIKWEVHLPASEAMPVDVQSKNSGVAKKGGMQNETHFSCSSRSWPWKLWIKRLCVSSDTHPFQWTRVGTVNPHGRGTLGSIQHGLYVIYIFFKKALKTERRGEGMQRESAGESDNENILRV